MRVVFFCMAALCVSPTAVQAQSADALQYFDRGNIEFREGKYDSAVESYEAALETGHESAALHYNLGNAYYRLDELGKAILHYEKALRSKPYLPELQHSLTLARSRTIDQFSRVPDPFWQPLFERLLRAGSPRDFFWIGFVFYVAAVIVGAGWILQLTAGNWIRRTAGILLIAGTLVLTIAFSLSMYESRNVRYVLVDEQLEVFAEPDELADVEARIHEGLVFDYLEQNDGWLHIRLPNGVTGWIADRNVARI